MAQNHDYEPPYNLDDIFAGLPHGSIVTGAGPLLGDALLHQIPDDLRRGLGARHTVVVLTVPDESWVEATVAAARRHFGTSLSVMEGGKKKLSNDSSTAALISEGTPFLFVRKPGDYFWPHLGRIGHCVDVQAPGPDRLGDVLRAVYGTEAPETLKTIDLSRLDYYDLLACIPMPGSMDLAIERLTKATSREPKAKVAGPSLESRAFGEAGQWGKQLARDMRDFRAGKIRWSDVDRGALLVGPPGTGKSQYFASLAEACDAHLIVTSVASWFVTSDGHLDGVIKAMRSVFADARRNRFCIIGFDEIEALPSRIALDSRHREWWITVVTDFLINLDSTVADRQGTVCIGATNLEPSFLDAALLRPGRLERVLRLGLPDSGGLEDLFRYHLGADLVGEDLSRVVSLAVMHSATAATVVEWTRAARRSARAAGRPIILEDLTAHLPHDDRSDDEKYRAAVHESGHVLVARTLGIAVNSVTTELTVGTGGSAHVTPKFSVSPVRAEVENFATMLLAGRVAEIFALQSPSAGASNDIAEARKLLTEAHAAWCLGDDLASDPATTFASVKSDMARRHRRAGDIIAANGNGFRRLVKSLLAEKLLTGVRIDEILGVRTAGPP